MKSFFKRLLRRVDLEFRNFSVEKSENARFFSMLAFHKVNTIFDIGANEGQFGVNLRDIGYKGKIISFEPLTHVREKLLKISKNDRLWEVAQQVAIGEENGEIEIHIAGNSESSSVLNMMDTHIKAAPDSIYIDHETVPLRKLDTLSTDFIYPDSVVFLKIDTQGYEEQVMNGAPALMKNIVGLQLEISLVQLYEGHSLFDEMFSILKQKGFDLWGVSTVFSDPNTAQLLQLDATFFRPGLVEPKTSKFITREKSNLKPIYLSSLVFFKSIVFYLFDSIINQGASTYKESSKINIVLIRQDAIGDFIIWLDTAKEYRKLYPPDKFRIILVGNELWCDLAKELPYWEQVIPVNFKKFKSISGYRRNILKQIKNLKAELAIQPTFSREFYHGDSLARASGAYRKISSAGDMSNRNKLKKWLANRWHTELIPVSVEPVSELERNAEFFSGVLQNIFLPSYPKLEVSDKQEILTPELRTFYVLSLGTNKKYREWPITYFAETAQNIYKKTGWLGLICGLETEFNLGEHIQKICDVPLENYAGRTTLKQLALLLAKSKILISNETGTAHIASAMGIPTVCILGGGHFGRFAPYPDLPGQTNYLKTVSHKMPCYGCNWECVYSLKKNEPAPCVSNISVDAVWEKVEKIIEASEVK
jgi:FkbM family methyltransferase